MSVFVPNYLDASIILSIFMHDGLTTAASRWIETATAPIVVSTWALCETADIVRRKERERRLPADLADLLVERMHRWSRKAGTVVEGERADFAAAYAMVAARNEGLRSKDALHVAICLRLGCTFVTGDAAVSRLSGPLGLSVTFVEPTT
jgi:predicted nucleic acid-binding protein